jgi:uridylate kinase
MVKKVIIISLGGSLIIPKEVDIKFLEKFREIIYDNTEKYRFVVVCGGGNTARNYINALEKNKKHLQSKIGIASTRLNARFLTYFFERDCNKGLPKDMKDIENLLKKHDIVFCGALRYAENQTSDSTSAKLARHFNALFINLTNVAGLYNKDPKKNKSAKFIREISHKDFLTMANKIKFHPGQHFVLDQKAAKIIKKYNLTTYILGPDLKNLNNLLNNKHFIGTVVS